MWKRLSPRKISRGEGGRHVGPRTYFAIDLKSYYASAECAARGLDPLTTNLVVADASRTEKTICLAVSPSLKALGIPGRARLFEVVQKVKDANADRLRAAIRSRAAVKKEGKWSLSAPSYDAKALAADPSLEISYLVAPPRMAYYEKVSRQIYGIYLKYVAPEDMVVYSIDEVFIDATPYLAYYNMAPHDLAKTMIREVLYTTGITATAGIGSNLYLAKLAMDITAKHAAPDKDGVRNRGTGRGILPVSIVGPQAPDRLLAGGPRHGAAVGKSMASTPWRAGPALAFTAKICCTGSSGWTRNFDRPRLGARALRHEGDQHLPARNEQHL